MREPAFWSRPASWMSLALTPLGALYGWVAAQRMQTRGFDAGVPVICVGNYHVGGAGKTPTVLALAALLRGFGETPVVLSRGYGGKLQGLIRVDPAHHVAGDVGDEPLMMASQVPVVVARDRVDGVARARSLGASVILMDDGFQNPAIAKDLSLIVIDGQRGLGNGRVLPAGPLRAPLSPQLDRTDALLVVGQGHAAEPIVARLTAIGRPVFSAHLRPDELSLQVLRGKRVFAFAGIGNPLKFFRTLRENGIEVVREKSFADHHMFSAAELNEMAAESEREALTLVTTEKDWARLRQAPAAEKSSPEMMPLPVTLVFDEPERLRDLISRRLFEARSRNLRTR